MESKEDLEDDGGVKNERVEMQQNERREQEVQEICREDEERGRDREGERGKKSLGVTSERKKAVGDHCEGMAVLLKARKEQRQTAKTC